jgi:hypothetical protein
MTDFFFYLGAFYAFMALAKTILCLAQAPVAIGTMSRLAGAKRGHIKLRYVITVPLLVTAVAIVAWIPSLYREKFSFFVLYRRFGVMRDCIRARRDSRTG